MTDTLFTPNTPTAAAALPRRVIGLDTSLTATGIAHSDGWCRAIGYTNKKNPITKLPHPARMEAMRGVLHGILHHIDGPDLVVMETPALSRAGGGAHERGWLWWEVYRHLAEASIPIGLMSTNQRALYATGKGNAGKDAVIDAVARRWPDWQTGGNDNCADGGRAGLAGRAAGCDAAPAPEGAGWLPVARPPGGGRVIGDLAVSVDGDTVDLVAVERAISPLWPSPPLNRAEQVHAARLLIERGYGTAVNGR